MRRAISLPICALVKSVCERTKERFVECGTNIECVLRVSHQYLEDIYVLLRKNEQ